MNVLNQPQRNLPAAALRGARGRLARAGRGAGGCAHCAERTRAQRRAREGTQCPVTKEKTIDRERYGFNSLLFFETI